MIARVLTDKQTVAFQRMRRLFDDSVFLECDQQRLRRREVERDRGRDRLERSVDVVVCTVLEELRDGLHVVDRFLQRVELAYGHDRASHSQVGDAPERTAPAGSSDPAGPDGGAA